VMARLNAVYENAAAAKGKGKTNEPSPAPKVAFHASDHAPEKPKPPTIEEKQKALARLAELYDTDPLTYAKERVDLAARLCTTRDAIDKAVRIEREKQTDDSEQSQATKLVAIGLSEGVRLWHNAEGLGYASVRVNGHWENYRLGSTTFEGWFRTAYGKRNTCVIGGQEFPQAPGTAAVKDAVAQLKGIAQQGLLSEPVIRVGGRMGEIWIDLGNKDWNAVRVTADGWTVEDQPNVQFVRTGAMRPLPNPVRGASIQDLRRVLNVRASDFVLCLAFELQALNPEGP